MSTRLGVAAAFVDGEFVPGDAAVAQGEIAAVGLTPAGSRLAVPGYVDLQVNGFAGIDLAGADANDYARVGAALAATGVTSYLPTLISLPEAATVAALGVVAEVLGSPAGTAVVGAHLEGPFLSPLRTGAHDPAQLAAPDPARLRRLLAAGPVAMVTLAPERPGALELIDELVAGGIVVALGHTDATADEARAAVNRGAAAVSHLFNAQRPFGHRDPGVAGVALTDDRVIVTIIADGVHLSPETVQIAARAAAGRFALITDAVAAAAMPHGSYALGGREVQVANGEARLAAGALAGSVLTMDRAVRNLLDLGIDRAAAVGAATAVPARLLRRPDFGSLTPGTPADVVVLNDDFTVHRTLRAGVEIYAED